jgi:hypothetical protein
VSRKPFGVALHFVDTEGMRGGRERRGPGGALRNEAEVRVAAQVVRLLDERCPRHLTMAVIAMYAEQVERMRQALGRRKFKRPVKIDTVDSFEGREEDLVVISLVRSNERGRIGFLRVPNRLNVAISRAKRLVACIGDSATLRSGEESMYGELVEAARAGGGWIPATELVGTTGRKRGRGAALGIDDGESDEAVASPARKKRRRRSRRKGTGEVAAAAVGQDGQPVVATPGATGEEGDPAAQPARKKRRRRRRRSGTGAVVAGGSPEQLGLEGMSPAGDASEGGDEGAPAAGEGTAAKRRRRRRRRARTGVGGGEGAVLDDTSAPGEGHEAGALSDLEASGPAA